jgi:hypothetical protein
MENADDSLEDDAIRRVEPKEARRLRRAANRARHEPKPAWENDKRAWHPPNSGVEEISPVGLGLRAEGLGLRRRQGPLFEGVQNLA